MGGYQPKRKLHQRGIKQPRAFPVNASRKDSAKKLIKYKKEQLRVRITKGKQRDSKMSGDIDLERRVTVLERHREEDRQQNQEIREDISELVAAVRESNVYYKESYKRIERGEGHRDKQDSVINRLSESIIKNQPAVDSVNRIKVGLLGVMFTVMSALIVNWFVATTPPPITEHDYKALAQELKELRAHKLEDH
ncbi:TMhelix containing protein [Vibrio phage 1.138.O._10N.261.48.A1]|nr:TMhelix containing protein [Vibrio phage 1.138.O._10N.261.48.A1]